ncbi:MAG: hypothetical protein MJ168_00055 [Clostridia bacterium]|nr:hypothetical protein [Clostridia bacterium]
MRKTLFLSDSEPVVVEKLRRLGYDTLVCRPNNDITDSVSTHADCALFSPDNKTYFCEQGNYSNIVNYFTKGEGQLINGDITIIPINGIKSPYPDDVRLNCKCFGKNIICNTNYISKEIADFAHFNTCDLIHCNQGYSACSTVKLSDNAAITDDSSVYNTLSSIGIDCIKVSKGSVKLKGFDYGFIGGCCGLTEKNKIVFTGSIDKHADAELIKSFLSKHRVEYINLTDGELIDIGGIIPLYSI